MSLLPLLLAFAVCQGADQSHLIPNGYVVRDHSLQKPYLGADGRINNWVYTGSTAISFDEIRLTADRQSQRGGLWNSRKSILDNWEAIIHFRVHGNGRGSLFGDGFAFWYTRAFNLAGNALGGFDRFTGLGIFFDTYNNNHAQSRSYPYIHAIANDGSRAYIEDEQSDEGISVGGCQALFRGSNFETYAKVVYRLQTLQVYVDVQGGGDWRLCFSADGIYLPKGYYFGVTSSTGHLADNHDIISISVSEGTVLSPAERHLFNQMPAHHTNPHAISNEQQDPQDDNRVRSHSPRNDLRQPTRGNSAQPTPEEEGSGFFFYIIVLLVIVGGVIAYLKFPRRNSEEYGKRYV